MKAELLTRDNFREGVFKRDGHLCVICGEKAQDAHHIMERGLWPDEGYYIDNGASLCGVCHFDAEDDALLPSEIREAALITRVLLPPHLDPNVEYTKWGIPLDGRVKYPRTPYLNPGAESFQPGKDIAWSAFGRGFNGRRVVVTEKLDGENTTMYSDKIHARSLSFDSHPSRDYIKQFHASIAHDIPKGWRICGENMTAKHSIFYDQLPGYFFVFSIWDHKNECLSWDETLEWCDLLGLRTVPVYFDGVYEEAPRAVLHPLMPRNLRPHYSSETEGYVIRNASRFHHLHFRDNVAKYVRANHVQTDRHWRHRPVVFNQIVEETE